MTIDWKKITGNKNIANVSRIVETFYVTPKRNGGLKIRIEVHEHPENEYKYMALASHEIWAPDQASPYNSYNSGETIEAAINESIAGLCDHDNDKFENDVVFYVTEDVNGNRVYIDGNGNSVTEEEARKKRNQWNEQN